MIAHIRGMPSRQLVSDALDVLVRLKHRGGQGRIRLPETVRAF